MKLNPQFVNGYKAPCYIAKIPRSNYALRLLWLAWRRWCLNEDYYRTVIRFTGPRPRGTNQVSTIKGNATAFRYYIEPRQRQPWRTI